MSNFSDIESDPKHGHAMTRCKSVAMGLLPDT